MHFECSIFVKMGIKDGFGLPLDKFFPSRSLLIYFCFSIGYNR
jgi:hypothetical protein